MTGITQFPDPLPLEISDRGGISVAVSIQDQATGLLDLNFLKEDASISLAVDTVVGSRNITLTAGHGLTTASNAGDVISLSDNSDGSFFTQCQILTVTGDVIFIDRPVNRIYTAADSTTKHSTQNMNVDGSSTPQIFKVDPLTTQTGDMTRIICDIRGTADMDFETFGSVPELTNGVVLRVNNGDGTFRNIHNFKSNGDMILMSFDHEFAINKGGSVRGFTSRVTWSGQTKHGVVIRLDGSLGEELQMIIQDDLTGLTRMHWVAQGSEVQGD